MKIQKKKNIFATVVVKNFENLLLSTRTSELVTDRDHALVTCIFVALHIRLYHISVLEFRKIIRD